MPAMRLCLALLTGALALSSVASVRADGTDDQYVRIFSMIQEADGLSDRNDTRQALAKYLEAQTSLQQFQKAFPEWSPDVVKFRLNYLSTQIGTLSTKAQGIEVPAPAAAAPQARKVPPPDWDAQLAALKQQLAKAGEAKALAEAKLKEALAAQPAAVDPRELVKAEEKVSSLQKENELLNATLTRERSKVAALDTNAVAKVQRTLDETTRQLAEEKQATQKAQAERDQLQARLKEASFAPAPDTNAVNVLQQNLAATSRQLAEEKEAAAKLVLERDALQERLKAAQSVPAPEPEALGKAQQALAAANKDLAVQKEQISKLMLEKAALQSKLRTPANETESVAVLRARIDALEAQKTPYSAEELALMKMPDPKLAAAGPTRAAARQFTATVAPLAMEAQKLFAAGDYQKAKEKYLLVLKEQSNNPIVLANLAVIESELNQLDEAEKHARAAIEASPEDAFNHSTLGTIKLKQGKVDEAIDALSRAAKLDPQSAEIQSRLGVAFSQKGLRAPAEAALRKALQLQPGYGRAHQNLAVIYANQDPPLLELALWHYQKAVAAGLPRDPEFEKRLRKTQ
jgi:cytochrome c-type biogenesis protein CcmH/NrfG